MKLVLVICRNCGDVAKYRIEDMTEKRKGWHNCNSCGNRTQIYRRLLRDYHQQVKLGNQQIKELLEKDKYCDMLFRTHKGFDYKKVEE